MAPELDNAVEYIEKNFKVVTKADEGGQSHLVPMKLWPAQKYYIENRTNRDLILKGRQMGLSTGVEAGNSQKVFTTPYQHMSIITHDTETSEFLLRNVERFHHNLPAAIRPKTKLKSTARITFPGLDAYIYIDSAKSDSIGIGHTLNIAHLSELSRWPDKKGRDLFAGISQTVPMGGFITCETTPKGRVGLFYEMWGAAIRGDIEYKTFFFPWWWDLNYLIPEVKEHKQDESAEITARVLGMATIKLIEQERQLMDKFGLSPMQIAFRRLKIRELRELFFQEYPENDKDCWLSNDMAVIDGISLRPYYTEIRDGRTEGPSTIWKDVVGGRKYAMGVDVASGSARDWSVASVIDCRSLEYVARIRGKIHPDLFAEEIYRMGMRYNQALLGVERAGHGHSVLRILLEKNYPNLYYHLDYNEIMKQNIYDAGWVTSSRTKLPMVNGVQAAFRSHDLMSWSENLLLEASALTWEGAVDTKIKTPPGGNDDEFDAIAIALQIRESEPVINEERKASVGRYASVF